MSLFYPLIQWRPLSAEALRNHFKPPPFAQFQRPAQILILEIPRVFLRLKFSPSLNLNKIERIAKIPYLFLQAGLLTLGSSQETFAFSKVSRRPHLPDRMKRSVVSSEHFKNGFFAMFTAAAVPDHSGGPVPVFMGVPF